MSSKAQQRHDQLGGAGSPTRDDDDDGEEREQNEDADAIAQLEELFAQLPGEELSSMLVALSIDADIIADEQQLQEEDQQHRENDQQVLSEEAKNNKRKQDDDKTWAEATERANAFFTAFGEGALLQAAEMFERGAYVAAEEASPQQQQQQQKKVRSGEGDKSTAGNVNDDDAPLGGSGSGSSLLLIDGTSDSLMRSRPGDTEGEEAESRCDFFDGFSRQYSDMGSSDDWILEKIVTSRRVPRSAVDAEDIDEDIDDDDNDLHGTGLLASSSSPASRITVTNKITQYLCKWRYYAECTWETQAALARLGFDDNVVQWEADARKKKNAKQERAGGGRKADMLSLSPHLARVFRRTVFEAIFPDWEDFIIRSFDAAGADVLGIANCAPAFCAAEFLRTWHAARGSNKQPLRVFHGARDHVIPAIVTNGLAVPGTRGCQVVNAQAFSRTVKAVYTAATPSTPMGYSGESKMVFVCALLSGRNMGESDFSERARELNQSRPPSDWCLVYENNLIVPVWMVHFQRRSCDDSTNALRHSVAPALFGSWEDLMLYAQQRAPVSAVAKKAAAAHHVVVHVPQDREEDNKMLKPTIVKEDISVLQRRMLQQKLKRLIGSARFDRVLQSKRLMKQLPKELEKAVIISKK